MPIRSAAALILLAAAFASPAQAAEPVFPPGSRIGLVPPPGLVASKAFNGFESQERKAAVLIFEMPGAAFADMEKSMTADALKQQGIAVEKRESFKIENGEGVLFTGSQDSGGTRQRKWLLLATISGLTAAINVQSADGDKSTYSDAEIRNALASLVVRPTPVAEQLDMLPFKFEELSGFRVVSASQGRTAFLTDGPSDQVDVKQSHFVISVAPAPQVDAGDRVMFARQMLVELINFKDLRVTFAEPIRVGGQQAIEVRADAKDSASGADLTVVQWLRFGASGVLRMVAFSPKDKWLETFPRFRAIRDGVALR